MGLFSFGKKNIIKEWQKEYDARFGVPTPAFKSGEAITSENSEFMYEADNVDTINDRKIISTGRVLSGSYTPDMKDRVYVIKNSGQILVVRLEAIAVNNEIVDSVSSDTTCSILFKPVDWVDIEPGEKIVVLPDNNNLEMDFGNVNLPIHR